MDNNSSITQHNREIHQNYAAWLRKPVLQKVYASFYKKIEKQINPKLEGLVVEIGSGMGNIKKIIPNCITTDLFSNPWIDQVESMYNLSFPDKSVSHLILFDVWHHLEFPVAALNEASRVLVSGGKIILLEPAMSFLGKIIYGFFHHEPLGYNIKLNDASSNLDFSVINRYFAAQSSAQRVFIEREISSIFNTFNICHLEKITDFSYWGSGGFSGKQLYPNFMYPIIKIIDKILGLFPSIFSARLLVVLEKNEV